uniref:Tubby C-terminal domain-containing protein n=1 Tax=Globisporangium ultimum (strain ATCC 200006 / CBS 805.95 / DAOM BR144) TaxID=431595 RepID=K3WY52_GLOUD
MGGSQSIETFKTYTTPGYKPKPQKTQTSQPQMSFIDSVRTITTPGYKPPTAHSSLMTSSMQSVIAFERRFCNAGSVTLHLREKFFSLSGDDFSIKDANTGAVWFRASGRVLSIREKKMLLDANSRPIANMKEEFFALMPSYNVYTGSSSSGSPLLNIHCKFTLLNTDLRVDFTNKATGKRCRMGLEGSWTHRKATIWLDCNGRQETVAKIYRPLTAARNIVLGAQDYYVQVSGNVDLALITLICLVLDEKASH